MNNMHVLNQTIEQDYALYQGDCVEVAKGLPDNNIHFSIFSPPFSGLYIYSDSANDIGNSVNDDEFFAHFDFLIPELLRVTIPGRLCAVHCKQLVNYKGRDGTAGLRDFRGEIIRHFSDAGWQYHSEVCIWKDPVIEMQRTKAHGLLYKQLRADSTFSRMGLPEYLIIFRKWARDEAEELLVEPVTHLKESESDKLDGRTKAAKSRNRESLDDMEARKVFPLTVWQKYASPVWDDIRQTYVLNIEQAREGQDEKHICPLQLDVIDRALDLWTNPGDTVLSPFAGIGSEGFMSLKMNRRFVGIELKESYWHVAKRNLEKASQAKNQITLFDGLFEESGQTEEIATVEEKSHEDRVLDAQLNGSREFHLFR